MRLRLVGSRHQSGDRERSQRAYDSGNESLNFFRHASFITPEEIMKRKSPLLPCGCNVATGQPCEQHTPWYEREAADAAAGVALLIFIGAVLILFA